MSNTVQVVGNQQVVVQQTAQQGIEVISPAQPAVVEVATGGPQGASGVTTLAALSDVDSIGKVDRSVLYYDATSSKWKGDDINTVLTLTDGGAF